MFTWGTATSAFQIEGALDVDGRGRSIWDDFQEVPGAIANGDRATHACRSYERTRDDVELIAGLGVDAYRFSVAWPRIVPDGDGRVNQAGLDHYDRFVDLLLEAGIEPWVTLYHWDLPSALQARGGWTRRATSEAFARYATVVGERLGDRVGHWITHNEPAVSSWLGHAEGIFAPGAADRGIAVRVAHELLVSHGLATHALRAATPSGTQVGITLDVNDTVPLDPDDDADVRAARLKDGVWARWFLDPVHGRGYPDDVAAWFGPDAPDVADDDLELAAVPIDFLGINHYRRDHVTGPVAGDWPPAHDVVPDGVPTTAMGWEVVGDALEATLRRLHEDYAPASIVVTENGAAYDDPPDGGSDAERVAYLDSNIAQVLRCRADDVPVNGYFAWSLLDNFEWASGYDKRFGLVRVDAATGEREPRASYRWYRDRIAAWRADADR